MSGPCQVLVEAPEGAAGLSHSEVCPSSLDYQPPGLVISWRALI